MAKTPLDVYVSARIAMPMLETARVMIERIPVECDDGGQLDTLCQRISEMLRKEMHRQLKIGDKALSDAQKLRVSP